MIRKKPRNNHTISACDALRLFTRNKAFSAVACLILLSACDGADNITDSIDPDEPAAAEQGGDEYWAELAQSYPAVEKPPGLGAARPPEESINFGRWEPTFDWPLIATGAANLPDGRIVAWSSQTTNDFVGGVETTLGTVYDPADGSFTDTPNSTHDMFCAGISMLEDGRVFVAGGGKTVSSTSIFDDGEFTEIEPMALTRWYPTSTTLASGQVFTSLGTNASPYPELWTDGKGWSLLPDISLQTILDEEDVVHNDWYPALNVAPDGSLFHPGHMPGILSIYMNTEDPIHEHGYAVQGDVSRLYNTTVMYDIGKMLIAGGGSQDDATNEAVVMDVNGPQPIITPTEPMKHVRSMQNSVVLPNGEVLVIGGNDSGIQFSDEGTVWEPEVWNPETGIWRALELHDNPRNYHSVALLLKDARVLSAGGGLCGECETNHQNGEIFSPPYLFDEDGMLALRPSINNGAANALPGDIIPITGSDDITEFNMLRLVAITHHHSTDQRFVPIDSVKTGTGEYELTLNSNPNVLLPGYYWIFGLTEDGVPTEGHTIQINVTPENQPDATIDTSPNIAYEYYEESWAVWELPDFDTLTPVKTGTQANFALDQKERNNFYAFRFRGTISVPVNGQYTFFLSSDDGSKLIIDNELVVDHDGVHSFGLEETGTATLTAGEHDIEVQYFEVTAGDALLASWQGPTFDKRPISSVDLGSPVGASIIENTNPGPSLPGKVSYRYYEGQWTKLPNFANETIVKEGEVDGFDLSPRQVNDYYGFEFTANLNVTNPGDYTFFTSSDDGSRLSVDGITVVVNDGLHPVTQQSGTISLAAGNHKIKVEFFEYAGGDSLLVEWDGPGFGKQTIPLNALASNGSLATDPGPDPDPDPNTDPEPEPVTGIAGMVNYQYYEGNWFTLPNFDWHTPVKEGQSNGFDLSERNRDDFYAMRFSGKLLVPNTGNYTLYSKSDDGSRITINGQQVVLNDYRHAPIEKQGNVMLTAGEHDIVVEFFEYDGGDSLVVSWSGPALAKQAIPVSALATDSVGTTTDPDPDTDPDPQPDPDPNSDPGLINYQYFEGQWFKLPNFDQLTPVAEGQQTDFSLASKLINDNYGFRFAAYVDVPADGLYSFYLASDDGSRLSIDGDVLIDNDGLHANREFNASQFLTAGSHHVLVEYFERGGLDTLDVSWSAASMPKQDLASASLSSAPYSYTGDVQPPVTDPDPDQNTDPDPDPDPDSDTVPQPADSDLTFEYYEGNWTSLPNFDLLVPLDSGSTAQFTLPPSNGVLFYGYRFKGKIFIENTGIYTFYTASNDGTHLLIDNVLVVDNNGKHGVKEEQGSVNLTAGLHDIEVKYFQSNGTEALNVYWSGNGTPKQIIPADVLFAP